MTPEEMGAALGPGWEQVEEGVWGRQGPAATVEQAQNVGTFWVEALSTGVKCSTPEAAVAVAHLLVAAERIAGGAAVATTEEVEDAGLGEWFIAFVLQHNVTPDLMRRLAIDSLVCSDEAEASP